MKTETLQTEGIWWELLLRVIIPPFSIRMLNRWLADTIHKATSLWQIAKIFFVKTQRSKKVVLNVETRKAALPRSKASNQNLFVYIKFPCRKQLNSHSLERWFLLFMAPMKDPQDILLILKFNTRSSNSSMCQRPHRPNSKSHSVFINGRLWVVTDLSPPRTCPFKRKTFSINFPHTFT